MSEIFLFKFLINLLNNRYCAVCFTFELLHRNVCPMDFQLIAVPYPNHIQLKEEWDFLRWSQLIEF